MNTTLQRTNRVNKSKTADIYSGLPIQETVTNGFFSVDAMWTVLTWNKAAEQLLRVTASDIVGKNIWEEFLAVLPLNFYVVYQKAFLQDVPKHFVEYWPEMDAWFDVITYHEDNILSVSFKRVGGMPRNREAKGPAMQLRILNELYKYITEVTNDCLWEWDLRNNQIFWIDGGHKRLFGYDIENALVPQRFWESRIHPDDQQKVLNDLQALLKSGSDILWETEYRFQKANGEYAHVCDRGRLMFDNRKEAVRMIGSTEDITKRKVVEMKLLESETKLAQIARQMSSAVVTTDAEGRISWVNEAFTRITGYSSEEVIGKTPGSFLQGKDTDITAIDYLREKIHAVLPFDCNILNYSKSGRPFWMHLNGQPLFNAHGDLDRYFAMETDVTDKVETENARVRGVKFKQQEIRQAVLAAQENERALIGRELHDNINQILGAARIYMELSKTDELNRQEYLKKASGYIINVIQDIRKISKVLITPVLVVGLLDSITILIDDLKLINHLSIDYVEDFDESELSEQMQFDIFRIIQEQLNNIILHANATHASVSLVKTNNQLVLLVTDNGKGCELSNGIKGVGIINIKTRATAHNANVFIVSRPGDGFELQVVFPMPAVHQIAQKTAALLAEAGEDTVLDI